VRFNRHFSLLDLVVLVVVAVAIFLPPRHLEAVQAAKGGEPASIALATAEARMRAHPTDGAAVAQLSRRLIDAGHLDWAIEAPARASGATLRQSTTRWRALLATSIAYSERRAPVPAREWVDLAIAACRASGPDACPGFELVRMEQYYHALDREAPVRPIRIGPTKGSGAP
jgi:hypothetical protein